VFVLAAALIALRTRNTRGDELHDEAEVAVVPPAVEPLAAG
jgi:hypothetical protein